ncbi:glypican-1-like isoform X2 [Buteo buteo]|uniref:glypican-1-like isoform X2 n=1 Tax=Buteo buteo TaxID=30397 RepID=UPI003EBF81A4
MRFFPWGFWLLCVASAPARGDSGSKARSCAEVRQLYGAKGFSLSGVPQAEISGYFQDLLNKSEKALYDAFPSIYGELYTQNMKVLKDLYGELHCYYRGSNINLEEALDEFWTRLLERLFKLMNPQYHIIDEYLDCMVKHAEQHKPFREVPRDLKVKAT